jgi:DNA-directed RNA polymerase subunit L
VRMKGAHPCALTFHFVRVSRRWPPPPTSPSQKKKKKKKTHLPRIRCVRDTKVEHAATFVIAREDHTVGCALRGALAADADVVFAGYRIPHPLEHAMHVRVATTGVRTPREAVSKALDDLADEVVDVRAKFLEAGERAGGAGLASHLMGGGGPGGAGGGGMEMGGMPPPPGGEYGGGGGADPWGSGAYGGGY